MASTRLGSSATSADSLKARTDEILLDMEQKWEEDPPRWTNSFERPVNAAKDIDWNIRIAFEPKLSKKDKKSQRKNVHDWPPRPWRATLLLRARNIPRLMRNGLELNLREQEDKDRRVFESDWQTNSRRVRDEYGRQWGPSNEAKDYPYLQEYHFSDSDDMRTREWVGMMFLWSPKVETLEHFDLDNITKDMTVWAEAKDVNGIYYGTKITIYSTRQSDAFNLYTNNQPLPGWWHWPRRCRTCEAAQRLTCCQKLKLKVAYKFGLHKMVKDSLFVLGVPPCYQDQLNEKAKTKKNALSWSRAL